MLCHDKAHQFDTGSIANQPDKLDLPFVPGKTRRRLRYNCGQFFGYSCNENHGGEANRQGNEGRVVRWFEISHRTTCVTARAALTRRRASTNMPRSAMSEPPKNGNPDAPDAWPALPLASWNDTRATLHMWTQMVGKVRLALTPLVNHWWNVPLYVSARGLEHLRDSSRRPLVRTRIRLSRSQARAADERRLDQGHRARATPGRRFLPGIHELARIGGH